MFKRGSGNGHVIFDTKIGVILYIENNTSFKMCKCGSGNEQKISCTEIGSITSVKQFYFL